VLQTTRNVAGAQQGQQPLTADASPTRRLRRVAVDGAGSRVRRGAAGLAWRAWWTEGVVDDAEGARRFDLFDAWIGDRNPRRAQIARGQEPTDLVAFLKAL